MYSFQIAAAACAERCWPHTAYVSPNDYLDLKFAAGEKHCKSLVSKEGKQ